MEPLQQQQPTNSSSVGGVSAGPVVILVRPDPKTPKDLHYQKTYPMKVTLSLSIAQISLAAILLICQVS